jgi:hypothetical protein
MIQSKLKRKINRTGDCFESAREMLMSDPDHDKMVLVHGLPTGRGGDAAKVGTYPHAWIEIPDSGVVYDTVARAVVPIDRYYQLGNIKYTKRYTKADVERMLAKHGADSCVWDRVIIRRDKKISKMRIAR